MIKAPGIPASLEPVDWNPPGLPDDPDEVMPPPDSGNRLTAEQIRLLQRWIDEGAEYTSHWSFIPPQRPTLRSCSDRHSYFCRPLLSFFSSSSLFGPSLREIPIEDLSSLM